MFKLCVLLLVITVMNCECRHSRSGSCKHRHSSRRQSHRQYEHAFHELSSTVISADRQFEGLCDSDNSVVEFKGNDSYSLRYTLGDYSVEEIDVKIRHRVLYVSARKSATTFKDIRILPRVVDVQSGQWYVENPKMYVLFGYKVPFKNDSPWTCDVSIDDRVRPLPNFSGSIELRSKNPAENSSAVFNDNVV